MYNLLSLENIFSIFDYNRDSFLTNFLIYIKETNENYILFYSFLNFNYYFIYYLYIILNFLYIVCFLFIFIYIFKNTQLISTKLNPFLSKLSKKQNFDKKNEINILPFKKYNIFYSITKQATNEDFLFDEVINNENKIEEENEDSELINNYLK